MGIRGPRSDDKMKAEWATICLQIQGNLGNMKAPQAERYFGVGTGSGRTWLYWVWEERLARSYVREKVISRAKAEGLLTAESLAIIKKIAAGADVSALKPLDVPEIPADVEMRPVEAALELWRQIKDRKISRYLAAALRYDGMEVEYERRAELIDHEIVKSGVDDTTAIVWIKNSYIKQFSQS